MVAIVSLEDDVSGLEAKVVMVAGVDLEKLLSSLDEEVVVHSKGRGRGRGRGREEINGTVSSVYEVKLS